MIYRPVTSFRWVFKATRGFERLLRDRFRFFLTAQRDSTPLSFIRRIDSMKQPVVERIGSSESAAMAPKKLVSATTTTFTPLDLEAI